MGRQKEWKSLPCCVAAHPRTQETTDRAGNLSLLLVFLSAESHPLCSEMSFWFHPIVVTSCQVPHWGPLTTNSAAKGCRDSSFRSLTPCAKGQHMEVGTHEGPGQSDGTAHPRRRPPLCRSVVLRMVGWGRGGRGIHAESQLICVVVWAETNKAL